MTANPTIERIPISFSGPGAGTAPLTWGQKALLEYLELTGIAADSCGAHFLPAGTTVETLVERLRETMSRHSALRMTWARGEDGRPYQVVSESGEIDLEVVTFDGETDPDDAIAYGNEIWRGWMIAPIDQYRDLSLRITMIRHPNMAPYVAICVGHTIADGTAAFLIMADLGLTDAIVRRGDPRTVGILELARREQTPEVRRINDRAMSYREGLLRDIAPLTFGEPAHPEFRLGKRYWRGFFHSPATYLGMLGVAARTRTDTTRALLAIIAIAIGRATGVNPLTTGVISSNRFRPGFAEIISTVAGESIVTLDLDGTVGDVVARVRRLSVAAGLHSYYDPDQHNELMARLDVERGYEARVTCRINDMRFGTRPANEAAARSETVTMDQIRAKLPETSFGWDAEMEYIPEQLFVLIADRAESVDLMLMVDTARFSEEDIEALLRAIEEVAVEAALDPDVPTQVAPGRLAVP
ncbi:MAG: condensation domain-containing protein [Labedaea sp.]